MEDRPPSMPRICALPGRGRPFFTGGLCKGHYNRRRKGISLEIPLDQDLRGKPAAPSEPCSAPGCQRQAKTKGLCALHYGRQRTGGPSLDVPIRPRNTERLPCSVAGCPNLSRSGGLCNPHYERKRLGLVVQRPLLSVSIIRPCAICGAMFARDKTIYCSRECADEAWARQKAATNADISFLATRNPADVGALRAKLRKNGYRPAKKPQGGTKPGLFTVRESGGLYRMRWHSRNLGPAFHFRNLSERHGEKFNVIAATLVENPFADMAEIAARVGVSRQRVHQIAVAMGMPPRSAPGSCEQCGRPGRLVRSARMFLCVGHRRQLTRGHPFSVLRHDRPEECSVPGCADRAKSRGMCTRHYVNWRYHHAPGIKERHAERMRLYFERCERGEVANPLPRCFDCDRALRKKDRMELEIGGDREIFCPEDYARRIGAKGSSAVERPAVDTESLFREIEAACAGISGDPELRDEVRQELYLLALQGELKPGLVREAMRSVRRQAMVAASDRSYNFHSIDDSLASSSGELTFGDRLYLFGQKRPDAE